LNLLLIPEWEPFKEADRLLQEGGATHRSMPLLAFERGHLSNITSVLHRYLLNGDSLKPNLTADYRNQLKEKWHRRGDPMDRHRISRIYLGKPMELLVANDFERTGIAIKDLEATGGPCDILGSKEGNQLFAEVKFIGTDDATFLAIETSTTGVSVGMNDPYAAADYLLSRLFEAAKQLERFDGIRIAVAVIDNFTSWPVFQFGLEHAFIDWKAPKYFRSNAMMKEHLEKLTEKYPQMDEELARLLDIVSEVRIYRLVEGYELDFRFTSTRKDY
jgi:hypothetical protein